MAPANVSFASTLPSAVPPDRGAAPVSFTASMGKGFTVIVTSAVSQLDRARDLADPVRQRLRAGAVPTATKTEPVAALSGSPGSWTTRPTASPARTSPACRRACRSPGRSPAPVRPGSVDALSFTASMTNGARTVTVTVPSSQFEAAAISQIRYTSAWIPIGRARRRPRPRRWPDRASRRRRSTTAASASRAPSSHGYLPADRWRGRSRPPCRLPSTPWRCRRRHRSRTARARPSRRGRWPDRPARTSRESVLVTEFVFTLATATTPRRGTAA